MIIYAGGSDEYLTFRSPEVKFYHIESNKQATLDIG